MSNSAPFLLGGNFSKYCLITFSLFMCSIIITKILVSALLLHVLTALYFSQLN